MATGPLVHAFGASLACLALSGLAGKGLASHSFSQVVSPLSGKLGCGIGVLSVSTADW